MTRPRMRERLIEVAPPFDTINKATGREESMRHGHPSTLHPWWERRQPAVARAVVFAQMLDDASEYFHVLLLEPDENNLTLPGER